MPSLKRDCTCALQRKAMSVPLRSRAVRSLRSMLLSKYREKWAGFAYFWGKDGGISLQLRLLAERVGFDNPETSIYCPINEIAGNRLNKRWLIIVAPFNHRCHALLLRACFSAF